MQTTHAALKAVIVAYADLFLALFFVCLKVCVRYRVTCGLGFDDALAALAWVVLIPLVVLIHLQAINGLGHHAEELPHHNLESVLHYFWVSVWVHMIALGISKLSILTQYLRIFLDQRTRLLTWLTMAFVVVYTLQAILVGVFTCIPVDAFWNRVKKGHCINPLITNYVNAGFNISTDLIIILIPIPALNRLQVSKSKYIALLVAFSIGGLSCVISIVRLHSVATSFKRNDTISHNQGPAMWAAIEVALAVICACLPSLRPILMRGLHALGFTGHSRTGKPKPKSKVNTANSYGGAHDHAKPYVPSKSRSRRATATWFLDDASTKKLNSRWSTDDEEHSLPDMPSPTFSPGKDCFIEMKRGCGGGGGGGGGRRSDRSIRVETTVEWASFVEQDKRERGRSKIGRVHRRL